MLAHQYPVGAAAATEAVRLFTTRNYPPHPGPGVKQ